MRDCVITGIGSTTFGRNQDRPVQSLAVEAANAALLRAGIGREEIGALYLGNFIAGPLSGQEVLAGMVGDELGLTGIPCTKVEGACASGGIAFRHAVMAVRSGACDAALWAKGPETGCRRGRGSPPAAARPRRGHPPCAAAHC